VCTSCLALVLIPSILKLAVGITGCAHVGVEGDCID
jgi:hypothetical protein